MSEEKEVVLTTCPNCADQYDVTHTGCANNCVASRNIPPVPGR